MEDLRFKKPKKANHQIYSVGCLHKFSTRIFIQNVCLSARFILICFELNILLQQQVTKRQKSLRDYPSTTQMKIDTTAKERNPSNVLLQEQLKCEFICNPHSFASQYLGNQNIFARPGSWNVGLHQQFQRLALMCPEVQRRIKSGETAVVWQLDMWKGPLL